jgi:TonB-dependent SusC/RagA subfamily outer membrane receptor
MKTIIPLLLILCFTVSSFGQKNNKKITITGTVVSASNAPVEGAAIFIDKVKTSSVTDQQGHYKVKVSADAKKILALSLFYGASEAVIDGKEVINFVLTSTSDVNAAQKDKSQPANSGNTEKNKNQTKPLGAVDGQRQEFASSQSIFDMIKGRFPGVEVSGTSIKISGSSSLNASTEPLFVVDGIIVNSIEDISPQSVKSIEVLKGPDASVYGMRGANGVIVITRLTGKDIK